MVSWTDGCLRRIEQPGGPRPICCRTLVWNPIFSICVIRYSKLVLGNHICPCLWPEVEDFDELTEKLEKMTLELQEKEDNWNEERRQLEEEKIERSV